MNRHAHARQTARMTHNQRTIAVLSLAGTLLSLAVLSGGCSSDTTPQTELRTEAAPVTTVINLDDFRSADAGNATSTTPGPSANSGTASSRATSPNTPISGRAAAPRSAVDPDVTVLEGRGLAPIPRQPTRLNPGMAVAATPDQPEGVTISPGAPAGPPSPAAKPAGRPIVVDALVGQINGKPVYASQFLEEFEARFTAQAVENKDTPRLWQRDAVAAVRTKLQNETVQELMLAEARSVLSPEERRGLLFFLSNIRENLVSQSGGSAEAANARLAEMEEGSLDIRARNERDLALLQMIYQRFIIPRVNVSWRDVQVEYDRQFLRFNPLGTATVRMIWAEARDTAKVSQITSDLASKPFADVASDRALNLFLPSSGGKYEFELEGRDIKDAKPFKQAELNTLFTSLSPTTVGGPITYRDPDRNRDVTAWMLVEKLDRPAGKTLQEAQLDLYRELRTRKLDEESRRFVLRIKEKGTATSEEEMIARLVNIAAQRFFVPAATAAATTPSPAPSPIK
jgi:hypothetical protein